DKLVTGVQTCALPIFPAGQAHPDLVAPDGRVWMRLTGWDDWPRGGSARASPTEDADAGADAGPGDPYALAVIDAHLGGRDGFERSEGGRVGRGWGCGW